ncbi:unnamed protein product [Tilletia controversa]|nr:unnamed protein product [Tilletia controversa]
MSTFTLTLSPHPRSFTTFAAKTFTFYTNEYRIIHLGGDAKHTLLPSSHNGRFPAPLPEALSELTFYKDKLWFRDVGVKDNYYGSLCNHRVVRQPREQDSVIQLQDGDQLEFGEFDQPIGSRDHLDFIDMCACSFFTACTNRHQLDGRSRSCGGDSGFNDTSSSTEAPPLRARQRHAPRSHLLLSCTRILPPH